MSPSLGRFVTPDPVKSFLNPYSYVNNNPVNMIDPLGLSGQRPSNDPDWHQEQFDDRDIADNPAMLRLVAYLQNRYDLFSEGKRLKKLMLEAAVEAEKMAATFGDGLIKENLEAAAQKLRDCANNGKYAVVSSIPTKPGAAGAVTEDTDGEGNVNSPGIIAIASSTMQLSDNAIIGALIHEASHLAFFDKYPNVYNSFDEQVPIIGGLLKQTRTLDAAIKTWRSRTEALATYISCFYNLDHDIHFVDEDVFLVDPAYFIDDHFWNHYNEYRYSRDYWDDWLFPQK